MSTDLSPVEQARAAQWAADLADEAGDHGTAKFFRRRADRPAPPETVESLRAERDAAREKLAQAECVITSYITALKAVRSEREGLWREVEQRNDDLHKANGGIACLRFTHAYDEAARGRCSRED